MKTIFCYDSLKLSGPWLCFQSLDVRYFQRKICLTFPQKKKDVEFCFIEKKKGQKCKLKHAADKSRIDYDMSLPFCVKK